MGSEMCIRDSRKLEHYYWEDNGALVRIMFENDKVYMLEQRGLK